MPVAGQAKLGNLMATCPVHSLTLRYCRKFLVVGFLKYGHIFNL